MWSVARGLARVPRLATPAVNTVVFVPRRSVTIAPGGPPLAATRPSSWACRERSLALRAKVLGASAKHRIAARRTAAQRVLGISPSLREVRLQPVRPGVVQVVEGDLDAAVLDRQTVGAALPEYGHGDALRQQLEASAVAAEDPAAGALAEQVELVPALATDARAPAAEQAALGQRHGEAAFGHVVGAADVPGVDRLADHLRCLREHLQ